MPLLTRGAGAGFYTASLGAQKMFCALFFFWVIIPPAACGFVGWFWRFRSWRIGLSLLSVGIISLLIAAVLGQFAGCSWQWNALHEVCLQTPIFSVAKIGTAIGCVISGLGILLLSIEKPKLGG